MVNEPTYSRVNHKTNDTYLRFPEKKAAISRRQPKFESLINWLRSPAVSVFRIRKNAGSTKVLNDALNAHCRGEPSLYVVSTIMITSYQKLKFQLLKQARKNGLASKARGLMLLWLMQFSNLLPLSKSVQFDLFFENLYCFWKRSSDCKKSNWNLNIVEIEAYWHDDRNRNTKTRADSIGVALTPKKLTETATRAIPTTPSDVIISTPPVGGADVKLPPLVPSSVPLLSIPSFWGYPPPLSQSGESSVFLAEIVKMVATLRTETRANQNKFAEQLAGFQSQLDGIQERLSKIEHDHKGLDNVVVGMQKNAVEMQKEDMHLYNDFKKVYAACNDLDTRVQRLEERIDSDRQTSTFERPATRRPRLQTASAIVDNPVFAFQ